MHLEQFLRIWKRDSKLEEVLYTHLSYQNDSIIKQSQGQRRSDKMQEGRRMKKGRKKN